MKAIVALCLLLVVLPVFAGTIISHDMNVPAIAKNAVNIRSLRHFEVYLPSGYDTSTDRYPVLYWLPGWTGSSDGLSYKIFLDKAIRGGSMPSTIVVFIDPSEGIFFILIRLCLEIGKIS